MITKLNSCHSFILGKDNRGSVGDGYKIEGIGEDFMPGTLDLNIVDDIVVAKDKDAFRMARRLVREESILAGSSSGAAVWAALKVGKDLSKDETIVVILLDTGRNYLGKIYSDEWMKKNGFL